MADRWILTDPVFSPRVGVGLLFATVGGMEAHPLLADAMPEAEERFNAIVSGGRGAQGKYYSLAYLRLALIQLSCDTLPPPVG